MNEFRHKNSDVIAPRKSVTHGSVGSGYWDTDVDGVARVLQTYEHNLEIAIGSGDGGILTMPDVAEAEGQTYFIHMIDDGSSKSIAVAFPGTPKVYNLAGAEWTPDALEADNDVLCFQSTGVHWIVLIDLTT